MTDHIELSAIVPICNIFEERVDLAREYLDVLRSCGKKFELIFVLDGAHESIGEKLAKLAAGEPEIRLIQLTRSFGEGTALTAGLEHSTGDIVLTLPAYYQVESREILRLLENLQGSDVVVGCRQRTGTEAISGGIRRRLFHKLVSIVTGHTYHDLGCGMRVLRRAVLEEIPLYGDLYRFIALLAARRGFRVKEIIVSETAVFNDGGRSIRIYVARLLDILTIVFLVRFTQKPLRFFGMLGSLTFVLGSLFVLVIATQRLLFGVPLADRPALLLSSLLVVLGFQLFALGLLGELIIFTHARNMKEYSIDEVVN